MFSINNALTRQELLLEFGIRIGARLLVILVPLLVARIQREGITLDGITPCITVGLFSVSRKLMECLVIYIIIS